MSEEKITTENYTKENEETDAIKMLINVSEGKISKDTIIRTILAAIALVNSVLIMLGKNPLPFSDEQIYTWLSTIATIGTTIWAWWKNNSFTPKAVEADKYLKELKTKEKEDK